MGTAIAMAEECFEEEDAAVGDGETEPVGWSATAGLSLVEVDEVCAPSVTGELLKLNGSLATGRLQAESHTSQWRSPWTFGNSSYREMVYTWTMTSMEICQ